MNDSAIVTQADALLAAISDAVQTPAPATTRAYESALRALDTWLAGKPLSDETLAGYLRYRHDTDGVSYEMLEMIRAAVGFNAKLAGVQSPDGPESALVLKRARRPAAGRGQVAGVRWEQADSAAAAVASGMNSSAAGIRDAALLAVMSDAMLWVSEASALDWREIVGEADGSGRLTVRRSKTGQKGEGTTPCLMPGAGHHETPRCVE